MVVRQTCVRVIEIYDGLEEKVPIGGGNECTVWDSEGRGELLMSETTHDAAQVEESEDYISETKIN